MQPSYLNGYYSPTNGEVAAHPELWDGCVGAWAPSLGPTGLTLRDQSGYGNHGTMSGSSFTVTNGPTAIDYNATNDYTYFNGLGPAPDYLRSQHVTACAWIRFLANTSGFQYFMGVDNSIGTAGWRIWAVQTTNGIGFDTNSYGVPRTVGTFTRDNFFHHVCGVFDGSILKIYYDGTLLNSVADTNPINYTNTQMRFGRWGGWSHINHNADDYRIYDRALTDAEIKTLAQRRGIAYETAPRRRFFVLGGGTAPTIQSAATNVAGDQITITFSEAVTTDLSGYTFRADGIDFTNDLTSFSGNGTAEHIWAFSPARVAGEVLTLDFDSGAGTTSGASGNLASFTDYPVTNNVPFQLVNVDSYSTVTSSADSLDVPPTLVDAYTELSGIQVIVMQWSESVATELFPGSTGLTYKVNGGAPRTLSTGLNPPATSALWPTLINPSAEAGDVLTLSYDSDIGDLTSSVTGLPLVSFTDAPITNNLPWQLDNTDSTISTVSEASQLGVNYTTTNTDSTTTPVSGTDGLATNQTLTNSDSQINTASESGNVTVTFGLTNTDSRAPVVSDSTQLSVLWSLTNTDSYAAIVSEPSDLTVATGAINLDNTDSFTSVVSDQPTLNTTFGLTNTNSYTQPYSTPENMGIGASLVDESSLGSVVSSSDLLTLRWGLNDTRSHVDPVSDSQFLGIQAQLLDNGNFVVVVSEANALSVGDQLLGLIPFYYRFMLAGYYPPLP